MRLLLIAGWTVLGAVSAYIFIAIYTFSIVFIPFWLSWRTIPPWMSQTLLYGGIGGFIVGLVKVKVVRRSPDP